MKLSSLLVALFCTTILTVALLLLLGVNFHRSVPAQGANFYDPTSEVTVAGVVADVVDSSCPVLQGEIGSHLLLKTADRIVQVHLAPVRILRSQKLSLTPGDRITLVGSQVWMYAREDLIAREIIRGDKDFVFRDRAGNLMLVQ